MTDLVVLEPNFWTPHLETGLEIALCQAEDGVVVHYEFIGEALSFTECLWQRRRGLASLFRLPSTPYRVGMTTAEAFARSRGLPITFGITEAKLNINRTQLTYEFLDSCSFEELLALEIDGKSVGRAIVGSLTYLLRDPRPAPALHKDLIVSLYCAYFDARQIAEEVIGSKAPNDVAVFNGRLVAGEAISTVARERGVGTKYWERGSTHDRYFFEAFSPHDHHARARSISVGFWHACATDRAHAERVAVTNYEQRMVGQGGYGADFVGAQERGLLRQLLPENHVNLVVSYFSSSEDEYAAFNPSFGSFGSQRDVVVALDRLARESDFVLVIRVHPNTLGKAKVYQAEWSERGLGPFGANTVFIGASSPVSTYEIVERSDVVVTVGSSVSFEAAVLGKAVVHIGDCLPAAFSRFGATASSLTELDAAIRKRVCSPMDREISLAVGYYNSTHGTPYRHYSPEGADRGRFLGRTLSRSLRLRLRSFWGRFPAGASEGKPL